MLSETTLEHALVRTHVATNRRVYRRAFLLAKVDALKVLTFMHELVIWASVANNGDIMNNFPCETFFEYVGYFFPLYCGAVISL